MKLTNEEKQYLEIYLWNDYNEKIVLNKRDLKQQNKLIIYNKSSDKLVFSKPSNRRIN